MKYIINESRLNSIVKDYISHIVEPPLKKHNHPSSMVSYIWFTNKNGVTVFESDDNDDGFELGVRKDIWNSVKSLFSLGESETENYFLEWFYELTGMEFPSGVYTFEDNND